MIKKNITVKNKLGLHARASNRLVELTSKFSSEIHIKYNEKTVDAKSIMSILLLAASKGSELDLIVNGDDEEEASLSIESLFNKKFDEKE